MAAYSEPSTQPISDFELPKPFFEPRHQTESVYSFDGQTEVTQTNLIRFFERLNVIETLRTLNEPFLDSLRIIGEHSPGQVFDIILTAYISAKVAQAFHPYTFNSTDKIIFENQIWIAWMSGLSHDFGKSSFDFIVRGLFNPDFNPYNPENAKNPLNQVGIEGIENHPINGAKMIQRLEFNRDFIDMITKLGISPDSLRKILIDVNLKHHILNPIRFYPPNIIRSILSSGSMKHLNYYTVMVAVADALTSVTHRQNIQKAMELGLFSNPDLLPARDFDKMQAQENVAEKLNRLKSEFMDKVRNRNPLLNIAAINGVLGNVFTNLDYFLKMEGLENSIFVPEELIMILSTFPEDIRALFHLGPTKNYREQYKQNKDKVKWWVAGDSDPAPTA